MNKRCLGCMEEYSREFEVCPHCGYVEGTAVDEAVHMEPGAKLVDRYIIGKVLGYGGFGVTYIGWDERLEQKVAIKEYLPSEFSTRMPGEASVTVFSGDRSEQFAEGLDKFVEEAKRLSKFQNEAGIVKVFDSFKANNTAYIIMEYLDGETLTSYMEREGVIPEEKAVEMLAPVMISLQAVHEEGILHRDIAPDNIFLTKNGEVKLIDFGASRYATTSHSRSLTVIIKPGYSPEEQYRSRGDQGPHTDVYALAAVMYKMITGITPPDALERRALIETKKKELLKDIHKTNKTISPTIENAILNAMNVQIEDRTTDIASFMSELNSTTPVKRRYGKIKKIDVYAWPLWVKIVIPAIVIACLVTGILLATGVIDFPSLFSGKVIVPEGMVVVPDVEGMDKDAALEEITKLGLTPSPEGNVDSAYVEVGKIVLQTPQGGSYLEKSGKVVLTVSSGSGVMGPVNGISTVPYVVWDTEEAGYDKLHQAGLEIFQDWAYDANVERGKIISQSITANEKVKQGTEIKIIVSLGQESDSYGSTQDVPVASDKVPSQNITVIDNSDPKNFEFEVFGDTAIITRGLSGLSGNVKIPSTLGGYPVVAIQGRAFKECQNITSVDIPIGITDIGSSAFAELMNLKKAIIPNGVTDIADSLFYGCSNLQEVIIPTSVTYISTFAFRGCGFVNLVIPSSVTYIDRCAFDFSDNLKTVTIPDSVEYIDESAFDCCNNLETIYFKSEEQKNRFAGVFSNLHKTLNNEPLKVSLVVL